jgi:catechol 2,3-dioxygenase-like lactoylglutathione lyase family enzyme
MTSYLSPVPLPTADAISPGIYREIYGMPAFATLVVADVAATVRWYTTGLGFIELFSMPGPDGVPALVHLRRWAFQDLLVRPAGGAVTLGAGVTLSFAAVPGELDELVISARLEGSGSASDPADTPWNTRDVRTVDRDGNIVIFTAGRPLEQGYRTSSLLPKQRKNGIGS